MYDKEIVEAVLADDRELAAKIAERKYENFYTGGAEDLCIRWIDIGTSFEIQEYDGSESVIYPGQQEYMRA